jgi:hypothetical protein
MKGISSMSYQDILKEVKRLSLKERIKIADDILHLIYNSIDKETDNKTVKNKLPDEFIKSIKVKKIIKPDREEIYNEIIH